MNEVKIKSFNEYVRYYEGSGILPILEDVYYTDYLNAINYFKLLPKYEKLEKRIIKYKKQIHDRNKKLEGCRSQLGQYVLNNQDLQQQLSQLKQEKQELIKWLKEEIEVIKWLKEEIVEENQLPSLRDKYMINAHELRISAFKVVLEKLGE